MKVLVTGANGYIGTRFVRLARLSGHSVVSATRRAPADGTEWFPFDFASPSLNLPPGIDAVVHLATGPADGSLSHAEIQSTRALLEKSRAKSQFIFVSSQTAREDAPTTYGRTKWILEQQVLKAGGIVVRPGQVYGGAPRALFGTLVAAVEKLPMLPAFLPAPKIQPIHVDDCALALLRILESKDDKKIYHLGAERPVSFNYFLKLITRNFNRRTRVFLPIPRFLLNLMSNVLGEARSIRAGLSRLKSLFQLPLMETSKDLATLNLRLRSLESGLHRSGSDRRRRLLIEAHAMLAYILDASPSGVLMRRYVKMLEVLGRGEALTIPQLCLKWPGFMALMDGRRSEKSSAMEFRWRLNAATLIAEASPIGAEKFLGIEKSSSPVSAIVGIISAVLTEALWRVAKFALTPFYKFPRGLES